MSKTKPRKPAMTTEERNARRRAKYREDRRRALADEYYERVRYGANRILREDYGKFQRWTWADRTGEWLDSEACDDLVSSGRVELLSENADQKVFGR